MTSLTRLAAGHDIITLGMHADEARRARHGAKTTFLRVAEVSAEHEGHIQFVGVNPQDDVATMTAFAEARGVEYPLLRDPNTYVYVCGLKAMEEGVLLALRDVAVQHTLDWEALGGALRQEGRLHLETY